MWAYAIKKGVTKEVFRNKNKTSTYVAPHNVKRGFHNDSCIARVRIMHALLRWNNCIHIAALFAEISSRNNKSERNDNSFIRTFRSPLV